MVHGKEVCRGCGTIISQCRCMEDRNNVTYGVCEKCQGREIVSLDERAPGPPTSVMRTIEEAVEGPPASGADGLYWIRWMPMKIRQVAWWVSELCHYVTIGEGLPTRGAPLHDYPLRSGDEFRALEEEVAALKAKAEKDRREAFEAGRSGGYLKPTGDEPAWYEFEWDTFGEWEAGREQ